MPTPSQPPIVERLRLHVAGVVQGVGFRPHVYRVARALALGGWVRNDGDGVRIEIEGPSATLRAFETRLLAGIPAAAQVDRLDRSSAAPLGEREFAIRTSQATGRSAGVQADMAPCSRCLQELRDPLDRRYRYPFLSCTECGPRFTILERLPYDRPNTSLSVFPLCPPCQAEYDDPLDRRFHAQPLACPACGPQLQLWSPAGVVQAERDPALEATVRRLREGGVVALKGLGGFQLVCRADQATPVARVRAIKCRPTKPLAIMVETLAAARAACDLEPGEEALLASPAAPIVVSRRALEGPVVAGVAPGLRTLGVMLPSSPLHHLLLSDLGCPLVVTSGNRPGEPMLTDERAALAELGPHVDALLVHDRGIANFADDSVTRWAAGRPLLLRRARGYVPLPVPLGAHYRAAEPLLAHGGHFKATLAVSDGDRAWISQHVGDLDSPRARAAYASVQDALLRRRQLAPATAACDLHPDYGSTRLAEASERRLVRVQHHEAHVLSVLAEHGVAPPALGIAWDGTGYGPDGTVWGGEALLVTSDGCERLARLRPFPLPGGDVAMREPRRAALGLLWALDQGPWEGRGRELLRGAFSAHERRLLARALERNLQSPLTSSVGRLFDAVAALTGLRQRTLYEAEAATALEQAVSPEASGAYRLVLVREEGLWELDWRPALRALLDDVGDGAPLGVVAARFHAGLADAVADLARASDQEQVVLAGGCFANRVLLEATIARLRAQGRRVDWAQRLPSGDGGLALGQLAAAARRGG